MNLLVREDAAVVGYGCLNDKKFGFRLDDVDYETSVTVAKAAVALSKVTLAEEQAKAEQARENWKALGRAGDPGELVARAPQVARAQADLADAQAGERAARTIVPITSTSTPSAAGPVPCS